MLPKNSVGLYNISLSPEFRFTPPAGLSPYYRKLQSCNCHLVLANGCQLIDLLGILDLNIKRNYAIYILKWFTSKNAPCEIQILLNPFGYTPGIVCQAPLPKLVLHSRKLLLIYIYIYMQRIISSIYALKERWNGISCCEIHTHTHIYIHR